jgi:hypothetical protein
MNHIFKWDYHSDQPYIITDKAFKKEKKKPYFLEYLSMFLSDYKKACLIRT